MSDATTQWPALHQALLARKKQAKVLAVVVLVLALGLTGALYAISEPGDSGDRRMVKAALQGGIMIVGGLIYGAWAVLHKPENHKLLRAMRNSPQDIVWIYKSVNNGESQLTVCMRSKKRFNLPLANDEELLSRVWNEVTGVAPTANLGWSEAKNNLFVKDPSALGGQPNS